MRYPALKEDNSKMANEYVSAIEKTLDELKSLENAEYRAKAIKLVYFDKTRTIEGAAMELHYSSSSVARWLNKFVNDVGKKVGF